MNPKVNGADRNLSVVPTGPPVCMMILRTSFGDDYVGRIDNATLNKETGVKGGIVQVEALWVVKTVLNRNPSGLIVKAIPTRPMNGKSFVFLFQRPKRLRSISTKAAVFWTKSPNSITLLPITGKFGAESWELLFGKPAEDLLAKMQAYAEYRFPV